MEFTLCSNDLLITDPYHETTSGICLISHVLHGIWRVGSNGNILLNRDYDEDELSWEYSDYSCDISQGLIEFSDFDDYSKALNSKQPIGWGVLLGCEVELIKYEIGRNNFNWICGIRVHRQILCENCNCNCQIRDDEMYYHNQSADLCKRCYYSDARSDQRFQLKCKQIYN